MKVDLLPEILEQARKGRDKVKFIYSIVTSRIPRVHTVGAKEEKASRDSGDLRGTCFRG